MAAREPLSAVKLISASHAEDAAFGALQDVAHLLWCDLTLTRQDGVSWSGDMPIPDEVGSLLLKVHAWAARRADKDAVDVWRCLEVAYAANVRLPSRGADLDHGRKILLTDFGARTGAGILAMVRSSNLSAAVGQQRATRVAALVRRVLG